MSWGAHAFLFWLAGFLAGGLAGWSLTVKFKASRQAEPAAAKSDGHKEPSARRRDVAAIGAGSPFTRRASTSWRR